MKLLEFRITNFRSIDDTGWCAFSPDSVTVLIGQNESGKSAILSALQKSFDEASINDDDTRAGAPLPRVYIRVETTFDEIESVFDEDKSSKEQLEALRKYISIVKGKIEYCTGWSHNTIGAGERFTKIRDIEDPILAEMLEKGWTTSAAAKSTPEEDTDDSQAEEGEEEEDGQNTIVKLTPRDVADYIYYAGPLTVLFDEQTGLLPNNIDIEKKGGSYVLSGDGAIAANNYLSIAGVDLEKLMSGDARTRQSMLHKASEKVTADFAKFWSQTIGKRDKLYLKCELSFYDASAGRKVGNPHLIFWISDGQNHLYPKQRSAGVRWFLSFYLQLKANDDNDDKVFLLDEPGANLHSKAQADVLKLINTLGHKQQIIYSTHSPHMLEYEKLYRVLAVQREGDQEGSPSVVIHAHCLGAASRDTLSVILTAMGADFSQQEVVKKHNNVILEEMSGFYYLKSFWRLSVKAPEAYFIAATGANNVELLANMFLGWGLGFVVAVDDDQTGRGVFNSIKRHMFGDDDSEANHRLLKINGRGIEDIFTAGDFKSFVLNNPEADFVCLNSQHVKDAQLAKAVLAYQFWIKVSKGGIKLKKFSEETQENISHLVSEISSRLN